MKVSAREVFLPLAPYRTHRRGQGKTKSWWAGLPSPDRHGHHDRYRMIALAAVTVVYIFHRTSAVVATSQPAVSVQLSKPNGPYPVGIQLTGGWIFSLNRSTLEQGFGTLRVASGWMYADSQGCGAALEPANRRGDTLVFNWRSDRSIFQ